MQHMQDGFGQVYITNLFWSFSVVYGRFPGGWLVVQRAAAYQRAQMWDG
jgi:hypothetical protein